MGDEMQEILDYMKGMTFTSVMVNKNNDELVFEDGTVRITFYHSQDCCESVYIEDFCGDSADLVGTPLLEARYDTSEENPEGVEPPEYQDCYMWTFYTFRTVKGTVTVRWYGDSNGYYSVSVDVRREFIS